ncbi:MAG: acetyl-CoA carboxylase biotin carboxylase subunit [Deltaproteobacteria bacterium]|jgi:acetyl-CoA carboxylase biotin carboxylase subunit|nr:acetyl-CoA carboxylase biotin carboxylase subunit [Deltaproteobacteria bacterium]MBW2532648.1 acetyl-CoA carboxylase biotin carboxylase subunit [Deltaproteobacteria bacterium]
MFDKVLIANRGEIAMRVIRTCRALGIRTVAIHAVGEEQALHVRFADEAVCVGPPPATTSYLNIPAIIAAAEVSGAQAIHPGYGFLSENASFAQLCRQCRLQFIGPTPEAMQTWGDKVSARANARRFDLPLLPGTDVLSDAAQARAEAERVGFPVILKAAGGGGGRGMRIVREPQEIAAALAMARQEAERSFGNPGVYLERYIERPRHIEFQIIADGHGGVWSLGERECSLQRRHQKIMEEAPSPALDDSSRHRLAEAICRAVRETGYTSAATFEFLMDERGRLYFMEVNTRIQVEHPVTELVTGVDLVELQMVAAAGKPIRLPDTSRWRPRGHAIECRINAEDPVTFAPWPGLITEYHPPGGGGVRVDSGVYGGWRVPDCYDSLIAKVIGFGATRQDAMARLRVALQEFIIGGIRTNIPLHQALLSDADVIAGDISTKTIAELVQRGL